MKSVPRSVLFQIYSVVILSVVSARPVCFSRELDPRALLTLTRGLCSRWPVSFSHGLGPWLYHVGLAYQLLTWAWEHADVQLGAPSFVGVPTVPFPTAPNPGVGRMKGKDGGSECACTEDRV